jgi:hypothetical protein
MLQHSDTSASQRFSKQSALQRWVAVNGSANDDGLAPWRVSAFHFPFYGDTTAKLAYCVRYAILAPSSHNSQPWRFFINRNRLELYADRTRALPVVDPDDRQLMISCGAALANLSIAIRHFGYQGDIELCPQPNHADLIATIGLGREHPATCQDKILLQTIPMRRTNRSAFENTPISRSLLRELQAICVSQGVALKATPDQDEKLAIATLVDEGDRRQMASPEFRAELAQWMRPVTAVSHDGMPCYVQNLPKVLDFAAPFMARLIRTFDMGGLTAARDADLANASAVLAVLSTASDAPADWLAVGMALQHILLTARAAGVWTSFLNQPVEVPELRTRLAATTACSGIPQVLLRLGYGRECEPTPRRGLDEVLSD